MRICSSRSTFFHIDFVRSFGKLAYLTKLSLTTVPPEIKLIIYHAPIPRGCVFYLNNSRRPQVYAVEGTGLQELWATTKLLWMHSIFGALSQLRFAENEFDPAGLQRDSAARWSRQIGSFNASCIRRVRIGYNMPAFAMRRNDVRLYLKNIISRVIGVQSPTVKDAAPMSLEH